MAKIRKRSLPSGEIRWLFDYRDQSGKRRFKQFKTKGAAIAYETQARGELVAGVHVADSASITIETTTQLWLQTGEIEGLEASTMKQRREHVAHILPALGAVKLSRLTRPQVEAFRDHLLKTRSRALSRAILGSLRGIIAEGQRRGHVVLNVASDTEVRISKRDKAKVTIPTKDHLRQILAGASDRWRPLLVTAIFTGVRCSELRGLIWGNVDFAKGIVQVRQRADFQNRMGPPKSEAGCRDVPMAPMVVNVLKAWQLACPVSALDLVFPSALGGVMSNGNIHKNCWGPLQRKLFGETLYTFHALRHAAASLFIEQGWSPKKVQTVMGHASIQMTYDTYGHLFPSAEDDAVAMQQIEARLLG